MAAIPPKARRIPALFVLSAFALTGAAVAETVFDGGTDPVPGTDFNDSGNWTSGLPDNSNGPGRIISPAELTDHYLMLNDGSPSVTDIIVNSTLNTGSFELQLRSGGVSRTSDLYVGSGSGESGILNIDFDGLLDIAGASSDLFIGFDGATGTVNVLNGGTLSVQKTIEVLNGSTLSFESDAICSTVQDELVIDDDSKLVFQIDGDYYTTIPGSSLNLEMGTVGSTLEVNFITPPVAGDTIDLITNIASYTEVGGIGPSSFQVVNVTGVPSGLTWELKYGATLQVVIGTSPFLSVDPNFEFIDDGTGGSYQIPIENLASDGTTPLNIGTVIASGSASGTVSNISAPTTLAAGASDAITFDFTPNLGAGNYFFVIEIPSDDLAEASPRLVDVTIEVIDPVISLNTSTLDFGTLSFNPGVQTAIVTVTNFGGVEDLDIDAVNTVITGDAEFSITSMPAGPIAPGASADIEVTFDPATASGIFSGVLSIVSNDYLGAVPDVTLSALVLPNGEVAALDFGTAGSPVANGFTQFIASEGASLSVAGVTVQLVSSEGDIVGAGNAGTGALMIDNASTEFNGVDGNYISVLMSGFDTGTLDLTAAFDYSSIYGLPLNLEFGEVGSLASIASGVTRPSFFDYSVAVESGKTYELRIIEAGNADVAYIAGLILSGDAVPGGTAYGSFVSPLDPATDGAPNLDPDNDGVETGIEWVVGGSADDSATPDTDKLPTQSMVTADPDGDTTDSDYLLFTYRQSTQAATDSNTTIAVRYGTDLVNWNVATEGVDGVVIVETPGGFGPDVDQVDVYIPTALAIDGKLFAGLEAVIAAP